MRKVPFTNTGTGFRNIGGVMIAPGATRPVDARLVPGYGKAKQPTKRPRKAHSDPVLALLDNRVADIVPQLPTLSDEAFEKVQQAERDGNKTRKSLKKAFDEEWLRRAAVAEAAGVDYDAFLAEQLQAADEDLTAALELEREGEQRQPIIDAFEAEIERRASTDNADGD